MFAFFHSATKTLLPLAALAVHSCSQPTEKTAPPQQPQPMALAEGFNAYWYAGTAEICTYDVLQERYGVVRQAEQVNIFVTEDFSRSKHVKLDDPAASPADRAPVLKLNAIRRFKTGIYDYSIMQSVFSPVSGEPALKATLTVQDWCGQVFAQWDRTAEGFRARGFSYFESEGDTDQNLPLALLEDELWARIRLNPETLPLGQVALVPSATYHRLRHQPLSAHPAELVLLKTDKSNKLKIMYADIPRTLEIQFEAAFPHKILSWEETDQGNMASKGNLKSVRNSPYWSENGPEHQILRDSLNLRF
jgi:hypothetical protein